MTDNENRCFPDPEEMSDEEKIALIDALHEAHHEGLEQQALLVNGISGLAYAMHVLSKQAMEGDTFGKRTKALRTLALKLEALYLVGISSIGVTTQDVDDAEKFSSIVEGLDLEVPTDIDEEE